MKLTKDEEKILDGERGEALQLAYSILVKVGKVLGATRLIKISHAHISGISYKNIGDTGLKLIKSLAEKGAKFNTFTTINPAGMDLERWREMNIPPNFANKQLEVIKALSKMGATLTLSCIPYYIRKPSYGEHLAWGESNAVLQANSVYGARTNREGGPLVLFEAIAGKAPYFGLHTSEGRKPTIMVDLEEDKDDDIYLPLFGYAIGLSVKSGVPLLKREINDLKNDVLLKLFLAAIGTSSSIGLIYIKGVTPDYNDFEEYAIRELDKLVINLKDLDLPFIKNRNSRDSVVLIGCPHLTSDELKTLNEEVDIVKKRTILFTSRHVYDKELKLIKELLNKGFEIYTDTCMVVSNLRSMGINRCMVDSVKAAYYLSSQGYEVTLKSRDEILKYIKCDL